jgi:Domain of unknown function (DUF6265)
MGEGSGKGAHRGESAMPDRKCRTYGAPTYPALNPALTNWAGFCRTSLAWSGQAAADDRRRSHRGTDFETAPERLKAARENAVVTSRLKPCPCKTGVAPQTIKRWRRRAVCALAVAILAAAMGFAASAQKPEGASQPQTDFPAAPIHPPPNLAAKPITLNDLGWLQGQWTGAWGARTATRTWSAPRAGTILGTLQIVDDDKTTVVEFVTIVETPSGLEYRLLHFTASLAPWEKTGPATLSLMSSDSRKFVFQNKTDGQPQQIVLTRGDPDSYTDHSEILPETGDPLTYDIVFHRQKANPSPNAGSAAHR